MPITANQGFLVAQTASIVKDASVINLTGNIDCQFVSSGTAIFLNGSSVLLEGISGTPPDISGNSQITVRNAYTGNDLVDTSMVSFNTIEGLRDAIRRVREVAEDTSKDVSQQFANFLTSTENTITMNIRGVDIETKPYGKMLPQISALLTSISDGTFLDGGTQQQRSTQAGAVPDPVSLKVGEISLNFADKTIFSKDAEGNIIKFLGGLNAGSSGDISMPYEIAALTGHTFGEGDYDLSGDFTFEINITIPNDATIRNLFTIGSNSAGRLGAMSFTKGDVAGKVLLRTSVEGLSENGTELVNNTSVENWTGKPIILTITRKGSDYRVWIDGESVSTGTATWAGLLQNPSLTLFAYHDDSQLGSNSAGVAVHGWRFSKKAKYNVTNTTIKSEMAAKDTGGVALSVVTEFPASSDANTLYIKVTA